MSPGSSTESYPAFAHIGLRESPGKNLNQITCPDRESNSVPPGFAARRAVTSQSRDQNIVRNGITNIGSLSYEKIEKLKYLGATLTNINDTLEEIKRRINSGNTSYYSVGKLLSYSLLKKKKKKLEFVKQLGESLVVSDVG
ncbi:hypothetical protein ANN_15981 [Periplaneta americana]|uniref:Uncharacterized protein n=1 Tax=Periplaneta americana TaxID=6978 RepID=A0ABQ8SIZ8_PERAM|nr:hypothetical protein ANN_15981 [Periplaneta americana]